MNPLFAIILISQVAILGIATFLLYKVVMRRQPAPVVVAPSANQPRQPQQPTPRCWSKIWKRVGWAIVFIALIGGGFWGYHNVTWSGSMPDWSAMWVWAKWPVLIVVGLTTLVLLARAGTETFIRLCLMMIVGTIIYFAYKGSSEKDSVARENQNSVPRLALRYNEWLEVDNNYWGDRYYDFTCESVAYYVSRSGEEPPSSQILGQPGVPMVYHVANNNRHKVNLPKAPKYFVLARGKIVERPELILNPPN